MRTKAAAVMLRFLYIYLDMRLHLTLIVVSTVFFFSCRNDKAEIIESDTSKVLTFAIRKAFIGYLPDKPTTRTLSKLGDSILFTSDSTFLRLLPTAIDTFLLKIAEEKQVCPLLLRDTVFKDVRNYLKLTEFTKTDSGYYIHLESLSCLKYGGGGALGLYINKVKDSFYIKSKSSVSIN